ncbi:hypothetical protein [Acidihalobacter ferrooxydans]|uniref:Peptidase C39-like domain-containing protein n=1 Tax=Acidihalobacter ferrooxydans TaxID=1765967 RepID=A0A1P8UE05_9GAMM|nr:hypothetical protein [Acidihalobacter ferrooxydans]APZ42036.1 hypothetical protein BW247_02090 [Acidihalobacter ferrooxydans]
MCRRRFDNRSTVPYFSQWESAALAPDIASGRARLIDDPHWSASGARTPEEYAAWANHVCGMACLKMVLATRTGRIVPTLELARIARRYGAYTVDNDAIRGLIYAPFVECVALEFGIRAEVVTEITAADLAAQLRRAEFFMASVHPGIREPQVAPPTRGGHLVLVTAAQGAMVRFHNPSGIDPATRADVCMPVTVFAGFFAGRGIAILR